MLLRFLPTDLVEEVYELSKNRPVHEIRLGRIKAVIWANDTSEGTRNIVQIRRLYKDGDEWKQSDSFGRDDLPLVAKVADQVHTWIFQQDQDQTRDKGKDDDNG